MTIYYIPLENLDMRYTKSMNRQIEMELKRRGVYYRYIIGNTLAKDIQTGSFLDANSTNYFKFCQLQAVCHLFHDSQIKDGDVFFFADLWFPGIECIPYMAYFNKVKVKICGIVHAGSWTETDFVRDMKDWAKHIEMGWFNMFDEVYVGSEWHKHEISMRGRCKLTELDKIIVTGLPFDIHDLVTEKRIALMADHKRDIVVHTGRLDDEKQPEIFNTLKALMPNAEFIHTHEKKLPKEQYYDLLAQAKVVFSAALQENFGYGILEAVTLGCFPVLPNRLAYKDFYPIECRYDTIEEAQQMIHQVITDDCPFNFVRWENRMHVIEWAHCSTNRIIKRVEGLHGKH